MRTCLGVIGAFLALLIVATLSMSWVVVYVRQRDEGLRLVIPAPVFLVDFGLRISGRFHDVALPPEVEDLLPLVPALVRELNKAPDFEMLRVEQPGLELSIRKNGDLFELSLQEDDQQVHIKAPLSLLAGVSRAVQGGHINTAALAGALDGISRTQLVDVRQTDQDVRVWIW